METTSMKETWEKVLEYATMPLQGTLSRKQREGVKIQINQGDLLVNAVIFIGKEFVRITETKGSENINSYYDWNGITHISTISANK